MTLDDRLWTSSLSVSIKTHSKNSRQKFLNQPQLAQMLNITMQERQEEPKP